ncbi:hypothetical protein [Paenibacillus pseudetheri]|uniref:Transposase n=1 Tax=Paenibacillus pseudetheri TaxID=2897682 RepID=A0ABN8F9L0_9BACL|nr:hypothetical protein [Paenibacillus pseudetheri]CAH1054651.1 hypothetical protein PAECIP111894_00798 [Paenibacillus pseudetheri]
MSYYNGLAALIVVGMMLHMHRVLNAKHYPFARRKLIKTIKSCGVNLFIELIRFEDHGPRRKLLYVHEIHSGSREQYEETKARIRRDWDIKMIEELMNALG